MKILVVEGQRQASDELVAVLKRAEYTVVRGINRENAKSHIHTHDPQIVVLVALPFQSWHLQLLRDLQGWQRMPLTLALTTSESSDFIALLEAGADACCGYPLEPDLCLAYMLALGRRSESTPVEPVAPEIVQIRDLAVDFNRYQVSFGPNPLPVTPAEFRILACLSQRAGKVVPTATLFREALGYEVSGQQAKDILKVHVRRIRNKIRDAGGSEDYVCNIRGFGYLLERRARSARSYPEEVEAVEEATT
ncbi:MAG: response regulator transcription factor [Dehalococcoidia bacterium]